MTGRPALIGSMVSMLVLVPGIVWAEDLRQIRERLSQQVQERLTSGGSSQRTIQERIRISPENQARLSVGSELGQTRPKLDVQVNRFDGRTGPAAATALRPEINRVTVPKAAVSAANSDDFIRK